VGNEEKNAEFCCTLKAKHHAVPSAAHRGNRRSTTERWHHSIPNNTICCTYDKYLFP